MYLLLEAGMATTPAFLPGESQGQRNLVGYSLWGHKESDTTEAISTHAPSMSVTTHTCPVQRH